NVAIGGVAVGDALDVAVDAEDFLDHDDGAARLTRGVGAVGVELVAIRCRELNHFAHEYNPLPLRIKIPAVKKNAAALLELATTALKRAGANDRMAEAAARHLVHAEEHGLPTHGMSRVPFYCGMLKRGRADGAAE